MHSGIQMLWVQFNQLFATLLFDWYQIQNLPSHGNETMSRKPSFTWKWNCLENLLLSHGNETISSTFETNFSVLLSCRLQMCFWKVTQIQRYKSLVCRCLQYWNIWRCLIIKKFHCITRQCYLQCWSEFRSIVVFCWRFVTTWKLEIYI